MRNSLVLKVSLKLIVCYLVSIIVFLVLCINPDLAQLAGVVILLVDMLYTIFIIYSDLVNPLSDLGKVLKPIDFESDTIDFTKLDEFYYRDSDEIGVLVEKFKTLSDVLVARVDRVNIETYKSEHDGLSGLYNRVKYQNTKDYYESCNNVCIIYIDVNNLKKMNDIFGHEAGDVLIKKASSKLKFFDGIGDCYRMGGDEFMVVITNKPRKECTQLINKWYSTVGCLNRKDDGFKCMMAYGVVFGGLNSDVDELVKEADEKMYQHKVRIKLENGEDPNSR